MKELFRIEPEVVAYDLHPHYLSTRFAQELAGVEKIGVQHHHAHIASCMAENGVTSKVIGVAFDGTGLRHGRQDLGRRIPDRGFRRLRAPRAFSLRSSGRRRHSGSRALASGAQLLARYVTARPSIRWSCRCCGAFPPRNCATGARDDRAQHQHRVDLRLRTAIRRGGVHRRRARRGQFRSTGRHRTGDERARRRRRMLSVRDLECRSLADRCAPGRSKAS